MKTPSCIKRTDIQVRKWLPSALTVQRPHAAKTRYQRRNDRAEQRRAMAERF